MITAVWAMSRSVPLHRTRANTNGAHTHGTFRGVFPDAGRTFAVAVAIGLGVLTFMVSPIASASPSSYLQALSQMPHPAVSNDVLLFAGQQACNTLLGIPNFDLAEQAVYYSILNRSGVIPNMADVGTIVHVAFDHLCPQVG